MAPQTQGSSTLGSLVVEPAEGALAAACACCAGEPGLRGFVYADKKACAVYFVEPIGAPKYPMIKLGVAIGDWSPGKNADARECFAFICRPAKPHPAIEPTDPKLSGFPELAMLGRKISAEDLPRHPRFADFEQLTRQVIQEDWRLEAIQGTDGPTTPPARRFFAEPS